VTPDLLKKYAQPVPRYTSYPTAPHFVPFGGTDTYRGWLAAVPAAATSLYVHIPFCDKLCWYCGCNTKATQRYEPVAEYSEYLDLETDLVAAAINPQAYVSHMHWGGGSPSILSAEDIRRLTERLRRSFHFADDAEIAVEVDPRHVPSEKVQAFVEAGFNRVSIGVQDFSPDVQKAINREQSAETTARVVEDFRRAGIRSINIDLVYGLPRQTREGVESTIEHVLALKPDRVALFGYAHLPSRLVHQRMIANTDLPDTVERFAQASRAASHLTAAGYVRIGLDHFARPDDGLARGPVHRNFQGYTTDTATTLIGLGASSIGQFNEGYVQNAVAVADYARRLQAGDFAVLKGRVLTSEDKARGYVIEKLLCDLEFSAPALRAEFGAAAGPVVEDALRIIESDIDGLIEAKGSDGSFEVTEKGRLFLRAICACFDAYLGQGTATHATGV
jgi:oxygen-independent coproporphyrinogen-3 oxidase